MANGQEIIKYRQKIMTAITNDREICEYILNRSVPVIDESIQEELTKGNIFKYPYKPGVQEEAKTYITFDMEGDNSNDTNLYKDISLYFWIFSHTDIIQCEDSGILRTDLLDVRVQTLFNNNTDFGIGKMICKKDRMLAIGDNYYGRALIFRSKELNADLCGGNG